MVDQEASKVFVASIACPRCQTDMTEELSCDRCGWIEIGGDAKSISTAQKYDGISWKDDSNFRHDIASGNFFFITVATFLVIGLLASVIVSVTQQSPGIAICFVVLALPPTVRTALVVWKRGSQGLTTSSDKTARMFVSSMLVTTLLGMTISVMSVVFSTCAVLFSLVSLLMFCFAKPELTTPMDIAFSPIGWLLILAMLAPYGFWIASRWQNDTAAANG